MFDLDTPIAYLNGIGPSKATVLQKEMGIYKADQLLNFFPNRYVDKSKIYTVRELIPTSAEIQLQGVITELKEVKQKRGSRLVGYFSDETGTIELIWFRVTPWLKKSIKLNEPYVIFGKLNSFNGQFSMPHPEMELLVNYKKNIVAGLQAIYPSSEKMLAKGLNNRAITKAIQQLVKDAYPFIQETLSDELIAELGLTSKKEALFHVHFPKNQEFLNKAQKRLKFEELFFIQLQLIRNKIVRQDKIKGHPFEHVGDYFNNFYKEQLAFDLTNAQKRVIKEIRADLASGAQMNRLLQGDVGSGKTIVAFLTMLLAIDNGFQSSLIAPTEILAIQHYQSFLPLAEAIGLHIELLTGSTKTKKRREIHEGLEDGSLHILVGTHAVLEDKVQFQNLGLAVIDEQHRFGVAQRSKMWKKGSPPLFPPKGRIDEVKYKYQTARPSSYKLLKTFQEERKKYTTEAERALWEGLNGKQLGVKFRRQHIIDEYIVDFVYLSKNLVVEVDGKYHFTEKQQDLDNLRTSILNDLGFDVIRFTNEEVIGGIDDVLTSITQKLESLPFGEVGGALIPPHILIMTATPIPRTLAMSAYGDLDISVIDELPPGRKPIQTVHRYDNKRLSVFKFMRDEITKGRQIYVVYPLIEESESMDYKDLIDGYESIQREFPLPDYKISIVHGKMKPADKELEMQRFIKGQTQIMVATTVIEVGVNVPNASVMVIESAERFGLSQLHQLRGRVGRGAEQSYCILMSGHKLSEDSKTRLQTMVRTNDGFEIAEVDLKLRGPGNLMGTQQSGVLNLKIADLLKDNQELYWARQKAIEILKEDPNLNLPKNKAIHHTYQQIHRKTSIWANIS